MIRNRSLLLFFISAFLFLACSRSEPEHATHQGTTNPSIQANTGEKVEIRYAEGFRVTYHNGYKLLEILNPWQDRTDTLQYALIRRGTSPPELEIDAEVIELPVRSMIVTSTTHLGLTGMLEADSVVKGVTQPDYVYSPEIRRGLEQGTVTPFSGGEFNRELALEMNPDLIMISGGQISQFDNFRLLRESGIAVMVNSEWLENTPLGKAEWVKMMGVLLNREEMANRKFGEVEQRYLELRAMADSVSTKPMVINNTPYKGAWFVSGGNSFQARYLKDAGADYPWFDTSSAGGLRLEFEAVYGQGLEADIWINPGSARSKEELLTIDSRFRDFKSFQSGQIYNNNRRLSSTGGNDYWESGVVHPEVVLTDLIRIFHPSLLPHHKLFYYQKLE